MTVVAVDYHIHLPYSHGLCLSIFISRFCAFLMEPKNNYSVFFLISIPYDCALNKKPRFLRL